MTPQHEEALEVPTTEPTDDRSLSPTTTISASLADAPLEASGRGSSPVAPAKPDVDLYSPSTSPNGQFAALAAQSASSQPPPPSNPPPPATLMAALGTTKAERPTLCAYNVGGAHGAAAVAVCGLTIQAPSGACALHSPPYSPSPHVASPSSCVPPISDSLHRTLPLPPPLPASRGQRLLLNCRSRTPHTHLSSLQVRILPTMRCSRHTRRGCRLARNRDCRGCSRRSRAADWAA